VGFQGTLGTPLGVPAPHFSGQIMTIEFDVVTPTNFTGMSSGAKVDTVYKFDFAAQSNVTDFNVPVAKVQNRRVSAISFSSPDSILGDTTSAGGRFYKMDFPTGLPDLSHTNISGLSIAGSVNGLPDTKTDVFYSFYLSQDSTLIERPLSLSPVSFYSSLSDPGARNAPLVGTRQNPRFIPHTFIRENFETIFSAATRDSLNGMISLAGTVDGGVYYIYVLADPATGRWPSKRNPGTGGRKRKEYDPFTLGALSGGVFLGRSGPLLVNHPPEFVVAGWDYDNDTQDRFDATGVIQVAGDMVGMANSKDNLDITVDTGSHFNKGAALAGLNSGNLPDPISTVDLLFLAQDANDPNDFQMNIFLSTQSGLGVSNYVSASPAIDSLSGAIKLSGTDTLTISDRKFTFSPIVRDDVTQLITSYVPEADYFVYFGATDGESRTLSPVYNDPFITSPVAARLSVKHSPTLSPDAFSLNDFDGSGDGDLDVITGIGVAQMQTDTDGKNLNLGPAQRYVTISWGEQGLNGDLDVDDNATIELYYSTRTDFRDSRGSVAYTSGNSDGSDILGAITQGNNDTHRIGSVSEDPDGQFDNQFTWDIWDYTSAEGTVPQTDARYYIYALLKGGTTNRLFSLTRSGTLNATGTSMAIEFNHPPFIRPIEPSRDQTVTVDEPVMISWEAVDVDNEESGGLAAQPAGTSGKRVSNSRTASPNIRILLTSADFGEVTTWGTITSPLNAHRFWVGNSANGALGSEIELNEGVDTSFVITGNRMRNNLFLTAGLGGSDGSADLQTNGGVGQDYYVYLAIDDGQDGTVGDAVTTSPQSTPFGQYAPVVRAPGKITFTGTVPGNPPTSNRFIIVDKMETAVDELIKYRITPEVNTSGTQINVIDIFLSVDPSEFEAVDTDPGTAGIQPFSLGDNSNISSSNVNQAAYEMNGRLYLDFIYSDVTGGLTFFDGSQVLAIANLRARSLDNLGDAGEGEEGQEGGSSSTGSIVNTTITLDNSGSRVSKMLDSNNNNVNASVPPPTEVTINRRSQVAGKVPLQGRTSSADTVTFFLRQVGSYTSLSDSLFETNDIDTDAVGIQILTTDVDGKFTLSNVPSGIYILSAAVPRHLTGHDTIVVKAGLDLASIQPTRDGSGIQHVSLRAGDAAGFVDSTGTSIPDNAIGGPDVNAINAALFTHPGETDYNTFADINRDDIVNATDKDYATANTSSNTGASGNIKPVFPAFKAAVLPQGSNKDALVTLTGAPKTEIRAGETFDVTINVAGARAVRTYEVHLSYDPTKLAVDNLVSAGDLLGNYLTDMSGKILEGEFGLVNSIIGLTPVGASGEGILATVRFRAISRSAKTKLVLDDAMLIDVEHVSVRPEVDGEATITLSKDPIVYHDAEGGEIKGLILASEDAKVDFNDFMALVKAFGTTPGSADYNPMADLNGDDQVNFGDFVIFSANFGKVAVDAPVRAGKTVAAAGANAKADVSLQVSGSAKMGELITITADLSNATAVNGWGLTLKFDPEQFEFLEATSPRTNLLTASGATAPVFLVNQDEAGTVSLANAISQGSSATGEGSLAVLTFKPKGEFENARFEVANGMVFDANSLSNPLFANDLEVKLAPAAFALNQNFSNPFNPETTIGYDLADGSQVLLEIYNVMGQLVNTLVSDHQAAGRYRVVWSGVDAGNRQVASGVYFYRLQTEGFKAVKKLMLLK